MDALEQEARIFSNYLVSRDASPQVIRLYHEAMQTSQPNDTDEKLLRFMVLHPHSIGFIDAGLVFHDATSEARRRLYVMFAILEASPEYYDCFLPKQQSPFYILVLVFFGLRAIIRTGLGLLLVKVLA